MPTPGYVFRDSGCTPPAEEESDTMRRRLTLGNETQTPAYPPSSRAPISPLHQNQTTDSHTLALADHDIKGAAQLAGRTGDVTDLGWRSPPKAVDTLVGGLPNEELWTLVRRFNRVRAYPPLGSHVVTV